MQRFLIRRLITTVIVLLAVSVIVFVMARAAGDPRLLMLDETYRHSVSILIRTNRRPF